MSKVATPKTRRNYALRSASAVPVLRDIGKEDTRRWGDLIGRIEDWQKLNRLNGLFLRPLLQFIDV